MTTRSTGEDKWCREELYPLLQALPNVRDVRYKHGQREQGKDFTFELTGPDGEDVHCAIQAKFGDVSGAAGEIGTLKAQLDEAFETPYENRPGDERWVDLLYVVCSGQFKNSAIDSLKHLITGGRAHRVRFLDGPQIEKWKGRALAAQHSLRAESTQLLSRALLEIGMAENLSASKPLPAAVPLNVTRSLAETRAVSDSAFRQIEELIIVLDNYNALAPLGPLSRAVGGTNLPDMLPDLLNLVHVALQKVRAALSMELAKREEEVSR